MGRLSHPDPGRERLVGAAIDFLQDTREPIAGGGRTQTLLIHADALVGILAGDETALAVLSSRGIDRAALSETIRRLFRIAHLNPEGEHYTTLLLPRNVSQEEISRRWKSLMRLYHPDHHGEDAADMAESLKSINRAYGVLKDESSRREYDRSFIRKAYFLSRSRQARQSRPLGHRNPARLILPICIMLCCFVVTGLVLFEQRHADFYLESAFSSQKRDRKEEAARVQGPSVTNPLSAEKPATPEIKVANPPTPAKVRVPVQTSSPPPVATPVATTKSAKPVKPVPAPMSIRPAPPIASAASIAVPDTPAKAPAVELPLVNPAAAERKPPLQPPVVDDPGQEVNRFLSRYIAAYEKGSVDSLMDCYSRSAVENGRLRYPTIRAAYQRNFEKNAYRYTLREVSHEQKGDVIVVSGSFEINKPGGSDPSRGRITWTLQRENGELRIARVDYTRQ